MSKEIYIESFVKCLMENLTGSCGYSKNYAQIQVGMLAKLGVKTWWDLISHSTEWYENLRGLSAKTKDLVIRMKDHAVWYAEASATATTFMEYKYGLAHWRRIRRYFFEKVKEVFPDTDEKRVMFTWGQLSQVSYDDLLKTKGIGNRTIRFLKDIQDNKDEWVRKYEENSSYHYKVLKESGK